MNGSRRLVLSGAALTALLAAVAVASRARRPGGGSGGGTSETPRLVFEYAASAVFVLVPVGVLVVLWVLSLGRRQKLLEGGGMRAQALRVLALPLVALPVALAIRFFVHRHDGAGGAGAGAPAGGSAPTFGRRPAEPAQFQWVAALLVGSLLLAFVLGLVALTIWKRHRGADWEREATLAAALDEVLADTLDDLRAERDPRKAVVAAYARMERTFAAHDVARERYETAREFVDRALDRLGVSTVSVRRLTLLYERAKFSSHEIDATMKDEAIDALAGLRAELDSETKAAA